VFRGRYWPVEVGPQVSEEMELVSHHTVGSSIGFPVLIWRAAEGAEAAALYFWIMFRT